MSRTRIVLVSLVFFAILFTAIAILQYWFVRHKLRQTVGQQLDYWADDLSTILNHGDQLDLAALRRTVPETARSVVRAATLTLTAADRAALRPAPRTTPAPARAGLDADLVMVMGIPGAGKTRLAAGYVQRGYTRLNRDERGGSLRVRLRDASFEHPVDRLRQVYFTALPRRMGD